MKVISIVVVIICAFCFFLTETGLYAANTAYTYGYSAEGIAMGNAMCPIVEDWSSVFYNISGLGKTAHLRKKPSGSGENLKLSGRSGDNFYENQLGVGFLYTYPQFKIDINRTNSDDEPISTDGDKDLDYGAVALGVAVNLNLLFRMPEVISSIRFGLGLVTNADGTLTKLNDTSPRTHNFVGYGREAQTSIILVGIGMGFFDDTFGIGGGVNLNFGGKGQVVLDDVTTQADEQTPESQSKMDLKVEPTAVAGVYFNPGKISVLRMFEGLQIGASYRQESKMEIDPFNTGAIVNGGFLKMEMSLSLLDFYTPNTYIFGVAYSRWNATISIQAEYQQWSGFSYSRGNHVNLENLPEMEDIIVPRIGVSYAVLNWLTVMAGYYYQPSFIPEESNKGLYNMLDNDKHVGSAGIKFTIPRMGRMGGPVDIILGYQLQYLVPRTVVKDEVDEEDDPDGNMEKYNPGYEYGGMAHTSMITVTMRI